MKIGKAAQALGVSTATVRNWLKLGDTFYSEAATRTRGKNILAWDLNQLLEVQRLLGEGMKFDEIREHLKPVPDQLEIEEPVFEEKKQETSELLPPNLIEQLHEVYKIALYEKEARIIYLEAELERSRRPWYKKLVGRE